MEIVYKILLPSLLALFVTFRFIRTWIHICHKWKLFDHPDSRKNHHLSIPTMAGLSIFAGVFISFLLFADLKELGQSKYLICASVFLFFIGFFDDLMDMSAVKKMIAQVIAAAVIAYGGIRIDNFYGVLGFHHIPEYLSYTVTILFIVTVTNAYNLIDGIDGLAGSIGVIVSTTFGIVFFSNGFTDYAMLSFCIAGALAGFLYYNFHPAKIFMGDTGSLLIGFILATNGIKLLSLNEISETMIASPAFVAAVLFIPIYDIIRVFMIRIVAGESPLKADHSHLHHTIVRQGFSHAGAVFLLCAFNLFIITLQWICQSFDVNHFLVMSICLGVLIMNTITLRKVVWICNRFLGMKIKGAEAG